MEAGLVNPIATTRIEPGEISRRLGIRFESAKDDLDTVSAALIRGPSGRQFALVRHEHQPAPGTDILTNENSRNFARDLQESLAVLQMTVDDLGWVHPGAIGIEMEH
jgi:hypothetical protein